MIYRIHCLQIGTIMVPLVDLMGAQTHIDISRERWAEYNESRKANAQFVCNMLEKAGCPVDGNGILEPWREDWARIKNSKENKEAFLDGLKWTSSANQRIIKADTCWTAVTGKPMPGVGKERAGLKTWMRNLMFHCGLMLLWDPVELRKKAEAEAEGVNNEDKTGINRDIILVPSNFDAVLLIIGAMHVEKGDDLTTLNGFAWPSEAWSNRYLEALDKIPAAKAEIEEMKREARVDMVVEAQLEAENLAEEHALEGENDEFQDDADDVPAPEHGLNREVRNAWQQLNDAL